jgi:hypothetical protein
MARDSLPERPSQASSSKRAGSSRQESIVAQSKTQDMLQAEPEPKMARHLTVGHIVLAITGVLAAILQMRLFPAFVSSIFDRSSETTHAIIFQKSSLDWSRMKQHHTAPLMTATLQPPPAGSPTPYPRIQFNFTNHKVDEDLNDQRRAAVREAFIRSWNSYKERAWLQEYVPFPLSIAPSS